MTRTIENPVTGERIEFRDRTADVLRFDYYLPPGGFALGRYDHVHPRQEERFEVRSGALDVRIGGDEWTVTRGTRFAIPPGAPHVVWNGGRSEMRALVEIRPSLDIATFFETMFGLARDGRTNRWGLPGPLQLAVVTDEFRQELYFTAVPRPLQVGVAAAVAPLGRLADRRARYPRYSGAVAREA